MPERLTTPFLARRAYRLRRMMDAARLLPVLGTLAVLIPVFSAGRHPQSPMWYGRGLVLLLSVWLAMVVAAWIIGQRLRPAIGTPDEPMGADEAGPAPAAAYSMTVPPAPGAGSPDALDPADPRAVLRAISDPVPPEPPSPPGAAPELNTGPRDAV